MRQLLWCLILAVCASAQTTITGTGAITGQTTISPAPSLSNPSITNPNCITPPCVLPGATSGLPYSFTFAATGGTLPYGWSFTVGTLPTGLTLDGSTGIISGTTTVIGTSNLTVEVTDAGANTATKAITLTVSSASAAPKFFGMHLNHNVVGEPSFPLPVVPISSVRMFGCNQQQGGIGGCRWDSINPSSGTFIFTVVDNYLQELQTLGVTDAMVDLGNWTPSWALNLSTELANYSPPKNIAEDGCVTNVNGLNNCDGKYQGSNIDWRNYVAAFASHLKANARGVHVTGYELYNEFTREANYSGTASWLGTPNQMLRLAEDANCIITGKIATVHATGESCATVRGTVTSVSLSGPVDSTALMGTPSSNDFGSPVYLINLNAYLNNPTYPNAPAAAADFLALHTYSHNNSRTALAENAFTDFQSFYAGITNSAIKSKPFWSTEGNYGGWGNLPSLEMEAGYVVKYYMLLQSLGFQKVYLYGYDYCSQTQPNGGEGCLWIKNGDQWGGTNGKYFTCSLSQGCLLQAGLAYQVMEQWLGGATQSGTKLTAPCANVSGTLWTCGYTLASGVQALAVWDSSQSCTNGGSCTTTPYPAAGNLDAKWKSYTDIYGNVTAITTTKVNIGYNPLLLQTAYTLANQQPVSPPAYSLNTKSVTTHPLPSDVMSHLATNSDAIATCVLTDCGNLSEGGNPSYMGAFSKASPGGNDFTVPFYYSLSSDPWYTMTAATPTGTQTATFHAPNAAKFSEGTSDEQLNVWDQTTGWDIQLYHCCGGNKTLPAASGCGSTQVTACPITNATATGRSAASNFFTSIDYGYSASGIPAANTSSAPFAGVIREEELQNGLIPHALMITIDCENTVTPFVFPALVHHGLCGSGIFGPQNVNRASSGMLLWTDYNPTQIAAFNLPSWQATILTALSTYGAYVSDTGGSNVGLELVSDEALESTEAWKFANPLASCTLNGACYTDPFWPWIEGQKGLDGSINLTHTGCTTGSGANASVMRCIGAVLANIGTVSGHIHVADPCIVKRYAQVGGSC